jgi:hypothetical protein
LKTYVKIEGANVEPIVQKLAKLAVELPEVCVWDLNLLSMGWYPYPSDYGPYAGYFGMDASELEKNCDKIIAKTGTDLGDNNMYFEWAKPPSKEQLNKLVKRIDGIIKPFGNKYKVTNKK